MPVILDKESEDVWLENSTPKERLEELLLPKDYNQLEAFTVSDHVNNPKNQGPELTKRVSYDKIGLDDAG